MGRKRKRRRALRRGLRTSGWLLLVVGVGALGLAHVPQSLGVGAVEGYTENTSRSALTAGEALWLDARDVRYLNRIEREQSTEVVYCGLVRSGDLEPRLARLVETSSGHARFSVDDCIERPYDGLAVVHTHPRGSAALSSEDRELLTDEGFDYVCIQAGRIAAAPGDPTERLVCYTEAGGAVERAPVRVG